MRSLPTLLRYVLPLITVAGCALRPKREAGTLRGVTGKSYPRIERDVFNQFGKELGLEWVKDEANPGWIDLDKFEVVDRSPDQKYIVNGRPTNAFVQALDQILEKHRLDLVRRELAQAQKAEVVTRLADFNVDRHEVEMVRHLVRASELYDLLHRRLLGSDPYADKVVQDPSSVELFRRNHGPWCETTADPHCSATAVPPAHFSTLYPEGIQEPEGNFCSTLKTRPEKDILAPFTINREAEGGQIQVIPYHEHPLLNGPMEEVARELELAAAAGEPSKNVDASFTTYLRAAAKAHRDGSWFDADQAWLAVEGKWTARVAPDEVNAYMDPCKAKAAFGFKLGIVITEADPESSERMKVLAARKQVHEERFAKLAGPNYSARRIDARPSTLVHLVLLSGDARLARGTSAGFTLPNWGPGGERARTFVYTNGPQEFMDMYKKYAEILLDPDQAVYFSRQGHLENARDHEYAHVLGPTHETRITVNGKETTSGEAMGPVFRLVEETKGDFGSLDIAFADYEAGLISHDVLMRRLVLQFVWSVQKIRTSGLYGPHGEPHWYAILGAVRLGSWVETGLLTYNEGTGRWRLHPEPEKLKNANTPPLAAMLKTQAQGDFAIVKALFDRFSKTPEGKALFRHDELVANDQLPTGTFTMTYRIEWPKI